MLSSAGPWSGKSPLRLVSASPTKPRTPRCLGLLVAVLLLQPQAAEAFLKGARKAAPDRTLIVLTDLPLRRRLEKSNLTLRLLETYGRPYSPWPRDPFSLVRAPSGAVRALVRPNLQTGTRGGCEPRPRTDPEPPRLTRPRLGQNRLVRGPGPVPQRPGPLTRDAAWVTLHTLEPHSSPP